jgi:tetratricopeptide (TPR) repeat protein
VFVSSVVNGLERERAFVHKLVTSLGWECDVSSLSESGFWGGCESACFNVVESADLYIAIFHKRSGSFLFGDQTFITEMEFYRALNARRPVLVYILEFGISRADPSLTVFLQYLKTEIYVRGCNAPSEFSQKLVADLEVFETHWKRGTTHALVPPLHLDLALTGLGILNQHVSQRVPSMTGRGGSLEQDAVLAQIEQMAESYDRHDFVRSASIGEPLFTAFGSLQISYTSEKPILYGWSRFLRMWAGSCTWLGYLSGPFGALKSAITLKETCRMLRDWEGFYEADSVIANVYYVIGQRFSALESTRQFVGSDNSKRAFLRALIHDELHAQRTNARFPHLHRAYVYLQLGKYDDARSNFERMLSYGSVLEERMNLDYSISLGQTMIAKGVNEERNTLIRNGLVLLDEGKVRLQRFFASPFYLPYMKRIAKAHLTLGNYGETERILKQLYPLAVSRGLGNQAEGINQMIINLGGSPQETSLEELVVSKL